MKWFTSCHQVSSAGGLLGRQPPKRRALRSRMPPVPPGYDTCRMTGAVGENYIHLLASLLPYVSYKDLRPVSTLAPPQDTAPFYFEANQVQENARICLGQTPGSLTSAPAGGCLGIGHKTLRLAQSPGSSCGPAQPSGSPGDRDVPWEEGSVSRCQLPGRHQSQPQGYISSHITRGVSSWALPPPHGFLTLVLRVFQS